MVNTDGEGKLEIHLNGVKHEEAQSFKQPGAILSMNANCVVDIRQRTAATVAMVRLARSWTARQ